MAEVAKHNTQRSGTVLIGECRIAYPYHDEKRTKSAGGRDLQKPHFNAVLLIPKTGPAESCPKYKQLSDMCMEAALKAWPAGWPEGGKWPIEDGDIPYQSKPKPGEVPMTAAQLAERNKWRVGYWCVEVSNYLKESPKVTLLSNGVMQDIPAKVVAGVALYKSGDFGFVSMNAFTFHNETWGVKFGYEGVCYTRQGEVIGNSGPKSTQAMFGALGGTIAPPAAPGAPVAPGAPRPPGPAAPTAALAPLPPMPPVPGAPRPPGPPAPPAA